MEWRKATRGSIFIGLLVATLALALDLIVDAFGARAVIAQALPIVQGFLPIIGIGLLGFAVMFVLALVGEWGQSRSATIIADMNEYTNAMDLLERPYHKIGTEANRRRARQTLYVLGEKYGDWLKVPPPSGGTPGVRTVQDRATYIAQVFRTHGHLRALRMIRRRRRQR